MNWPPLRKYTAPTSAPANIAVADPVTLDFVAVRLERIQTEQASMRAAMADIAAGQTVLTQMVLRVERNIVQIKDHLGRMDNRIANLEPAGTS